MTIKEYKENIRVEHRLTAIVIDEFGNEQPAGTVIHGYSLDSVLEQEHKLDYAINNTITAMFEDLPESTEV